MLSIIDDRQQTPGLDIVDDRQQVQHGQQSNVIDDRTPAPEKGKWLKAPISILPGMTFDGKDANVSAEPIMSAARAAASIASGFPTFLVSGLHTTRTLLDTRPEFGTGKKLSFSDKEKKATKQFEMYAKVPAAFLKTEEDEEIVNTLMKPFEWVDVAGKFYGDAVEKKTGSAELAATTKTAFEYIAFFGLPKLKAKLVKNVKAGNAAKIKETAIEIRKESLIKLRREPKRFKALAEAEQRVKKQGIIDDRPAAPVKKQPSVVELTPQEMAEKAGVKYDGYWEDVKAHQFTDINKSGSSITANDLKTLIKKRDNARGIRAEPVKPEIKKTQKQADLAVYHGSNVKIDNFDMGKVKKWNKFGHFFTPEKRYAKEFGSEITKAAVKLKNPKTINYEAWNKIRLDHAKDSKWFSGWKERLKSQGHDGLRVEGSSEQFAGRTVRNPEILVAFEDAQVKTIKPKGKPKTKVETDRANQQKIKNSVAEGELTLRTGSFNGKKLGPEQLEAVRRSVNNSRAKLGQEPIPAKSTAKSILESEKGRLEIDFAEASRGLSKKIAEFEQYSKVPKGKGSDIVKFDTGKIVKQRRWKSKGRDMQAPPIYDIELKIVKSLPEIRNKPLKGATENPIRTFEELGNNAKELYYRTIKEGEHQVALEQKATNLQIKKIGKGLSLKSRKRIGAYAISKQNRGPRILRNMGVESVPELTPKEIGVYKELRNRYEHYYKRLNRARALAGKDQFPKVQNYFTFFRDLGTLEKLGFNPITTRAEMVQAQFVHLKTTPFRFAKARAKLGAWPVELDAVDVFSNYSRSAIQHIHMSPRIAKLRETLLTFGDRKSGTRWILKEERPRTAKFLAEWIDFQAGQKPISPAPFDAPLLDRGLRKLNENLAFSILSGNIRSALIQPSAIRGAVVEIGPRYTGKGIMSLINPKVRNSAIEKSNVLLSRQYDAAVQDVLNAVKGGKVGAVKKSIGKAGFKPLQLLDMETAKATWQGAYQMALEKLRYSERKAINFADDVVTKTQASAARSDLSPMQRTTLGKTLSLFQTFVINEWGFLTKDVLGIKNARITNKQAFKKTLAFIAGTTLINIFYEDILGINSPYPTPIRAFTEAIENDEGMPSASLGVIKELAEQVPIVGGGIRYGRGVVGAVPDFIGEAISRKPTLETAGKLTGIPGTVQAGKMVRAKKRGETTYGQFVGAYTKGNKKSTRYNNPGLGGFKNMKGL